MKSKYFLLFMIILLQFFNFTFINNLELSKLSDNIEELNFYEDNLSSDFSLAQDLSLDSPFNNTQITIEENNNIEIREKINNSLSVESSIPADWNANPTFENLTYNLVSDVDEENTSLWMGSEENELHNTFGYTSNSLTGGPNNTGSTFFFFDSNNSLSKHIVFENQFLNDDNFPHIYFSPTILEFDFSILELIGDYTNTDHRIYLQFLFGNDTNFGIIEIWIKYNPNYLPHGYFSPGVYCDYPSIILLANDNQNTSWIHFQKNITSLIQNCFPINSYSSVDNIFKELISVKLKIDIMSLTGIFEGNILLDNIKIKSNLANQQASTLIDFNLLSQNTTNFEVYPIADNIERFSGFVNYNINNSFLYNCTLLIYPEYKDKIFGNLTLLENNMSPHGNYTDFIILIPILWRLDNSCLSIDSFYEEFYYNSSFTMLKISTLSETQNLRFIVDNIIDMCEFQQTLEKGDFFQITGTLKLVITEFIIYQILNEDNQVLLEEKVLCYSNGYFEIVNIKIPEDISSGEIFQRVYTANYPKFGFSSEILTIQDKKGIFIVNDDFSPFYEFEHAEFSVKIIDQNNKYIKNATLFIIGPFGSFLMEYSPFKEKYFYNFSLLNVNVGNYIITINASYNSLVNNKDFSIIVNPTEFSIEIENLPSSINPKDNLSVSLDCYKNNSLFGYDSFNFGYLYFYVNETLFDIKNLEDKNLTFCFGNFPDDSKIVILHFYLKISSITYASKIIGLNFVKSIDTSDYFLAIPSFYDLEVNNVNTTTNILFNVNYPTIGEFWKIDYKTLGIIPEECRIKRNDIEYNVNINNSFLQWNLESFGNETDILIIKIKTPNLVLSRTVIGNFSVIEIIITTNSTIPIFYAIIDTVSYETDIIEWKIYNSLNVEVTFDFDFEILSNKIILYNLSLNSNGVIYIKLKGNLPEFVIFSSEIQPNNPQYFDDICITYNISYSSYLTGQIELLINNKIILIKTMFSTNTFGNRLLYSDIGPFNWNTNISIKIKILNLANQILYEESKSIQIYDSVIPEIVNSKIMIENEMIYLTLNSFEPEFASGIKNCSIIYSDYFEIVESKKITNQTYEFCLNKSLSEWEEIKSIEIYDKAGNRIILSKSDLSNLYNSIVSNPIDLYENLLNIVIPFGMGIFGIISSVALFIIRKSGQIIEL